MHMLDRGKLVFKNGNIPELREQKERCKKGGILVRGRECSRVRFFSLVQKGGKGL